MYDFRNQRRRASFDPSMHRGREVVFEQRFSKMENVAREAVLSGVDGGSDASTYDEHVVV
jgi:hypothetical protein